VKKFLLMSMFFSLRRDPPSLKRALMDDPPVTHLLWKVLSWTTHPRPTLADVTTCPRPTLADALSRTGSCGLALADGLSQTGSCKRALVTPSPPHSYRQMPGYWYI